MAKDNLSKEAVAKLKRYIIISDDIDDDIAKITMQDLFKMESEDPSSDIVLVVNSSGGYVDSMWAIIDSMELLRCRVHTLCVGKAMSAAALILMSGSSGCRYASPNARIMIHQISGGARGITESVEIQVQEQKRLEAMSRELISRKTKIQKTQLDKMIINDWYMSASEAAKYGIVDKVIDNFGQIKAKGATW